MLTIDRQRFCSIGLIFVILVFMLQYSVIQFQLSYNVKFVFDAPLVIEKRVCKTTDQTFFKLEDKHFVVPDQNKQCLFPFTNPFARAQNRTVLHNECQKLCLSRERFVWYCGTIENPGFDHERAQKASYGWGLCNDACTNTTVTLNDGKGGWRKPCKKENDCDCGFYCDTSRNKCEFLI